MKNGFGVVLTWELEVYAILTGGGKGGGGWEGTNSSTLSWGGGG